MRNESPYSTDMFEPEPLKLLSIQPFYGGSHQAIMEGWIQHSIHRWQELRLPPRHWKWRMRHGAVYFADQVDRQWQDGTRWDSFFTTDMLNVAEFKGLLKTSAKHVPIGVYFHENQIAYPNQRPDERDLHFAFTNLTSILAADYVWFNSEFNRASLISGLRQAASKWPDFAPIQEIGSITARSQIEAPGIHLPPPPNPHFGSASGPVHLVWAARWEHDKNPAGFLQILQELKRSGLDFRVSVIGQTFRRQPPEFEQIRLEFRDQIEHWGYQPDRESFWKVLFDSDIFISTAVHEFYGLAVMEGLAAGLIAILPNRLAYPEIGRRLDKTQAEVRLYNSTDECVNQIKGIAERLTEIRAQRARRLTVSSIIETGWPQRGPQMDRALQQAITQTTKK